MEDFLYLKKFGKAFIPKKIRPHLREYLLKAGVESVPYKVFGAFFWISTVLTYFIYITLFYPWLKGTNTFLFGIYTFTAWVGVELLLVLISGGITYFYFNIKIYKRTKELEEKLPDYLTLVSTNLKGGMAFEEALWNAIRPEFGILAKEIGLVSKKVMTGREMEDVLEEFAKKYDSPILKRSLNLLIGEVSSGGEIADVLDRIIDNLKKTKTLKKEMASSTLTYMIFIGALVAVISPVLFALSFQLFQIISGFMGTVASNIGSAQGMSFNLEAPQVDYGDFKLFSAMSITVISVFSSMIISIIEKGDIKGGLKYIPVFLVVSLLVYFISSALLSAVFSGMALG